MTLLWPLCVLSPLTHDSRASIPAKVQALRAEPTGAPSPRSLLCALLSPEGRQRCRGLAPTLQTSGRAAPVQLMWPGSTAGQLRGVI